MTIQPQEPPRWRSRSKSRIDSMAPGRWRCSGGPSIQRSPGKVSRVCDTYGSCLSPSCTVVVERADPLTYEETAAACLPLQRYNIISHYTSRSSKTKRPWIDVLADIDMKPSHLNYT